MELLRLAEVDSTLTRAAELLAAGKKAPFAVVADRQTAGRGRRGHGWESPAGNLHVTIVMPAPQAGKWAAVHQGALPLLAGVLVARAIQATTGVRATLKWPNDILFSGRKLGGLLLETSSSGQAVGDVLIGIGLNIAATPAIAGTYQAIAMQEIVGASPSPAEWAAILAASFESGWNEIAAKDVPEAFAAFAVGEGQTWRDIKTGRLGVPARPAVDGTLPMIVDDRETLVLSSADHGFAWLHLGPSDAPLVVADIGNTRVKFRRYASAWMARATQSADVASSGSVAEFKDALQALVPSASSAAGQALHVLSVNPAVATRVADAARSVGLRALPIPKRTVLRRLGGYDLEELGIDRLAGIEGYLAKHRRSTGLGLVVQAGTATTIDVIRNDGTHLGGLILPGLKTSLAALHDVAAMLPDLDPLRVQDGEAHALTLGHDTASAMREGARFLTAGAILRVLRDLPGDTEVLVTGGYARDVAAALNAAVKVTIDDELVLRGARAMILGGMLPKNS